MSEMYTTKVSALPKLMLKSTSQSQPEKCSTQTMVSPKHNQNRSLKSVDQSEYSKSSELQSKKPDNQLKMLQCDKGSEKKTLEFETLPESGKTEVVVTHFQNFGEFYVRLRQFEKAYNNMMTALNRITASKTALKKVFPGMFVAALYAFDGNWYRGRVDKVNGDKAKVLFVDFGNTEIVKCQDIRPFPYDMYSFNAQAIKCSMTEIVDCPEKTFLNFKSWIEESAIIVEPNNSKVNLYKLDGTDIVQLVKDNAEAQKTQVSFV